MKELSLIEYFRIIVKRKWLIIIISILFSLSSFLSSKYLITPTYSATATLIVGNTQVNSNSKDSNYNELLYYDKLVSTYSQVLQSNSVLKDTASKLPFTTTVGSIKSSLTISTKDGTSLIYVTVKNQDPEKAMEISNQISNSFVNKITDIMKIKQNVNIVDLAETPTTPISPNIYLNTLIALFIGFMLSMFLAIILEFFDNSIKSPDDIRKYMHLPVISVIPYYDEVDVEGAKKK
ncbi:MAG: YveK family protein [Clostridiaceae bacterium]